ncbi:hypothetical protein [Fusobacterium sp. THCT1E2]
MIAHYCLHKLRILPSQYLSLEAKEKAFVEASIILKIEKEAKEAKEIGKKGKKRR